MPTGFLVQISIGDSLYQAGSLLFPLAPLLIGRWAFDAPGRLSHIQILIRAQAWATSQSFRLTDLQCDLSELLCTLGQANPLL